jgi:hypothetical protein
MKVEIKRALNACYERIHLREMLTFSHYDVLQFKDDYAFFLEEVPDEDLMFEFGFFHFYKWARRVGFKKITKAELRDFYQEKYQV